MLLGAATIARARDRVPTLPVPRFINIPERSRETPARDLINVGGERTSARSNGDTDDTADGSIYPCRR